MESAVENIIQSIADHPLWVGLFGGVLLIIGVIWQWASDRDELAQIHDPQAREIAKLRMQLRKNASAQLLQQQNTWNSTSNHSY
ncbi:hypothetical protein [Eupransor demetentiae]|uniref:Uncharacterized protein n=1 Tax=Eupransor demetentiae TaxID=3109584 RepID=A0ABM9N5K1_9LACO|nr:hypothetical protein R54876_GBNLAHCA_01044 [Lactobacillaceae bacterium LMG 33000]